MAAKHNKEGLCTIPVDQLLPAANQPRTRFNADGLKELSASIAEHGILQPLVVIREGNHYRLIAGERRLRAAKMAGLTQVPCVLTQKTVEEAAKLSLIENLQREDLSFFEEATAYRRLMEEFKLTQADVARAVSKDPSTVANKLRVLRLPLCAQIRIHKHGLTERHARALLQCKDADQQMDLLDTIIDEELTVKETEQLIQTVLTPKESKPRPHRVGSIKDVRLCINTLNHTVATLKRAGIKPQTRVHEEERFVEYIVRIPKHPNPL